jgi:hypothetical protein
LCNQAEQQFAGGLNSKTWLLALNKGYVVLLLFTQEDADEPADPPSSKLRQLLLATKAWLLGEGRPKVDMEDIREARGVTAFAKETLMPALYEVRC